MTRDGLEGMGSMSPHMDRSRNLAREPNSANSNSIIRSSEARRVRPV